MVSNLIFKIKGKVLSITYKVLQNPAHSYLCDLIYDSFFSLHSLFPPVSSSNIQKCSAWALYNVIASIWNTLSTPPYLHRLNSCFILISSSKWPSWTTIFKITPSSPYPVLFYLNLVPLGMYVFVWYLLIVYLLPVESKFYHSRKWHLFFPCCILRY